MAEEIVHAGARLYVWRPDPSLWMTVLWDVPTASDVEALVRLHESAFRTPDRFESLVDFRGVTVVDPVAFEALASFAGRCKADFDRQITKQALVRPSGLIGALVTGFFEAFGFQLPVRSFDDQKAALAWLRPDAGDRLSSELTARVATWSAVSPLLRRLRELLANRHDAAIDLGWCARDLGTSERTLQRQLHSDGTSFRAELTLVRVEAAKRLLLSPDNKMGTVALEVGFSTPQSFAVAFREHTGESPTEWRSKWCSAT